MKESESFDLFLKGKPLNKFRALKREGKDKKGVWKVSSKIIPVFWEE